MKLYEREYVRYHIGSPHAPYIILDAPHGVGPSPLPHDERTSELVRAISNVTGCPFIEATKNRSVVDMNRFVDPNSWESICAHVEYRQALKTILSNLGLLNKNGQVKKKILLLAVHGMKNYSLGGKDVDVELGTMGGVLAPSTISKKMKRFFQQHNLTVLDDNNKFPGHPSLSVHIFGGDPALPGYKGFGKNLRIVQMELSNTLRTKHFKKTCSLLTEFINTFSQQSQAKN